MSDAKTDLSGLNNFLEGDLGVFTLLVCPCRPIGSSTGTSGQPGVSSETLKTNKEERTNIAQPWDDPWET